MTDFFKKPIWQGPDDQNFFYGLDNGSPDPDAWRTFGRVHIGAGALHNNARDGSVTGGSWLQSFSSPGSINPVEHWDYAEDQARLSVVSDASGGIAISGASRTSGGNNALGVTGFVLNDNSGLSATAGYFDSVRANGATKGNVGIEINVANLAGVVGKPTPYQDVATGVTNTLRLAAGSDTVVFGDSYAIGSFIHIINNGGMGHQGILFEFNSILRDGQTDEPDPAYSEGFGRAMVMPYNIGFTWYSRDGVDSVDGDQAEVVKITSTVKDPTVLWRMQFDDNAFFIGDDEGPAYNIFSVKYGSGDVVNGVSIEGGISGAAATVTAFGGDDNVNLKLTGKGTGIVGFGEVVSQSDAAITGHIEVLDLGTNTVVKLAVVA
jgi:hypothetical protein